ncbi:hypothetical protein FGO68_gene16523 [Halteria grandinella]|uniref:Uncharacterized protein n=1 Tax=Halteria grandinella TaxID=5974 RepID=A0A8J8NPB8_HALGN|nr:hypothetical protein FGO68_gene16523 [Halteria grandinella]
MPPDDALPMLSQTEVKAMLSDKFKKYNARLDAIHAQAYEKVNSAKKVKEEQQYGMKITFKQDEGKVVAFNENYNTLNCRQSPSFKAAHAYIQDSTVKSLKPILKPSSSVSKYDSARTRNPMGTAFVRKNSYAFTAQPPEQMLINQQRSSQKSIRFSALSNSAQTMPSRKMQDQALDEDQKPKPLRLDGSTPDQAPDRASEYVTELEGQVIKMRTDNEIMSITLRHLQDELNIKSDLIRRQQQEMSELRSMLLEVQGENQRLRAGVMKEKQNANQHHSHGLPPMGNISKY